MYTVLANKVTMSAKTVTNPKKDLYKLHDDKIND